MMLHIKDVMKRLIEAERAKVRLIDILQNMQDETTKYWYNYIIKNMDVSFFYSYYNSFLS